MAKPYMIATEPIPAWAPRPPWHASRGNKSCSCHCLHPDDLTTMWYICCGCGQKKLHPAKMGSQPLEAQRQLVEFIEAMQEASGNSARPVGAQELASNLGWSRGKAYDWLGVATRLELVRREARGVYSLVQPPMGW